MSQLLDQLRGDLSSFNTDTQLAAARQLCEQQEWDAVPELLRLLQQDECGWSVAQALPMFGREICDQVGYLLLEERQAVRARAALVLATFSDGRAVKPLLEALKEPFFPEQVLLALGRLRVPDLDRQLARELSHHQEATNYPAARFRAAFFLRALTQMQSQAAVDLAPHFLREPHDGLVRQRAQDYLSAIAPDRLGQVG